MICDWPGTLNTLYWKIIARNAEGWCLFPAQPKHLKSRDKNVIVLKSSCDS